VLGEVNVTGIAQVFSASTACQPELTPHLVGHKPHRANETGRPTCGKTTAPDWYQFLDFREPKRRKSLSGHHHCGRRRHAGPPEVRVLAGERSFNSSWLDLAPGIGFLETLFILILLRFLPSTDQKNGNHYRSPFACRARRHPRAEFHQK